jgi:hypothetical protein
MKTAWSAGSTDFDSRRAPIEKKGFCLQVSNLHWQSRRDRFGFFWGTRFGQDEVELIVRGKRP